jgi:taurine dioxygenase
MLGNITINRASPSDKRGSTDGALRMCPLTGSTGIEIGGVDLREPLADHVYDEIRRALCTWGVVFFRDQDLTPEQQISFARRFGTVVGPRGPTSLGSLEGYPELHEVRRKPSNVRNPGGFWHVDQCFKEAPAWGTVLYARELPTSGGDTMFAHMGAVLATLSEGLRETLRTLRAVQDRTMSYEPGSPQAIGYTDEELNELRQKYSDSHATHPVVARHPETGQEVLFVNPGYTLQFEGWTREESRPLIQYLCNLAVQPENVCRFKWANGSLALWDNRVVMHLAVDDYPGQGRLMHRCIVRGPWLEPL